MQTAGASQTSTAPPPPGSGARQNRRDVIANQIFPQNVDKFVCGRGQPRASPGGGDPQEGVKTPSCPPAPRRRTVPRAPQHAKSPAREVRAHSLPVRHPAKSCGRAMRAPTVRGVADNMLPRGCMPGLHNSRQKAFRLPGERDRPRKPRAECTLGGEVLVLVEQRLDIQIIRQGAEPPVERQPGLIHGVILQPILIQPEQELTF